MSSSGFSNRTDERRADAAVWFRRCPPRVDLPPLVVVLCHAYSFSGGSREVFGAFETEADAMDALRHKFYFPDDF
jgi:hypothetical protein